MKSKIAFLIGLSLIATTVLAQFKDPDENKLAQFKDPNEKLAQFQDPDKDKDNQRSAQNNAQNSNAQILAFLIVVNKNEIAVSNEALSKQLRPLVKNYALMLNKDHSENLKAAEALSDKINLKPEETQMTNNLKEKGEQELNLLKTLNNNKFETTFIDDMVKGHQEALTILDADINKTNNPQLKQFLIDTKKRIAVHLQHAKSIQEQLKSVH